MIRINRRVLLITLIVVPVTAISLFALNRFQVSRQGPFVIEQARKLSEQGEYSRAIAQYQFGERLGERNFEVYAEWARCLQKASNHQASYLIGLKAQQYNANDPTNVRLLAEEALASERYPDAKNHATSFLANNPNDAEILLVRARANAITRDFQAAISDYLMVIDLPSSPVDAFLELATLYSEYVQPREVEKGQEIIDRLTQKEDAPIENLLAHGQWYLSQFTRRSIIADLGEMDKIERLRAVAASDATEMTRRFPASPKPIGFSIRLAALTKEYDQALRLATEGIERFPNEFEFYELAASNALELGKKDIAADTLRQGLARFPNESQLLWVSALLQLENEELEAGRDTLSKLQSNNYSALAIDYMEARFLAAEGRFLDAIPALERLRQQYSSAPEVQKQLDVELSRCFKAIGNRDQQITALRRACSKDSGWLAGREELAIALLDAGRTEEAAEEYRVIAEQVQKSPNKSGLPMNLVLNQARLLVMQNLGRDPSARDWVSIDRLLQSLEDEVGNSKELVVLRAETLLAQTKIEEARTLLAGAEPSDATFAARIRLEAMQGDWVAVDEWIRKAQELHFDSMELRIAEALRWIRSNDPSAASRIEALADMPEEWPAIDQLTLLQQLLANTATVPEFDSTSEMLAREIIQRKASDLNSRLVLLDLAFRSKDAARMGEILKEIEKISGPSALWHFAKALQALTSAGNVKALTESMNKEVQYHLSEAESILPEWAEPRALSGSLYSQAGDVDNAVAKYLQAVELGWRRIDTIQDVLNLLFKSGRYSEADAVIRRLSQTSQSLSSSMSSMGSRVSFELANYQRAIVLAEEAAKASEDAATGSDDLDKKRQAVTNFLWLAKLKEIQKDFDGSETAIGKALELDPTSHSAMVWRVLFLARNARVDEGRDLLAKLTSMSDLTDPVKTLALTECYVSLGMREQAKTIVEKIDPLLLTRIDDCERYFVLYALAHPSRDERITLLASLATEPVAGGTSDKANTKISRWAKRRWAQELIGGGGPLEFQKAVALVQENLANIDSKSAEDSKTVEDRRMLGIILATWKGAQEPSAALQVFESLIKREGWKPDVDDQFLIGELFLAQSKLFLAQDKLFLAQDNWDQAKTYFLESLANPENRKPQYLKRYAAILMEERGDLKGAESVLDLLRGKRGKGENAVQDLETAGLLAELRFRRGQFEVLFQDLLGEDLDDPEVAWFAATATMRQRFKMMNVYLTKLKNDDKQDKQEAFDLYSLLSNQMGEKLESSADFPGAFFAIQLLGRKEFTNAINALEKVMRDATQEELTDFAEAILQSEAVPAQEIKRLEQLFQSSNRSEDANVFAVIVARLREARGYFTGAEEIYRQLLTENPDNAVVLNNLANLLALKNVKLDEALTMINRAIELEGPTAMLLDTRGICHLARKDFPAAVNDLEQAVAEYPHPLLQFHLAWALDAAGQKEAARKRMESAKKAKLEISMLHVLERSKYGEMSKEEVKSSQ